MTDEELIERLSTITGQLYDQPELLAEWSRDWWPFGAKTTLYEDDLPLVAVVPDTAEDVAAVVRLAAEAGRAIIAKGGGSNLVGMVQPRPGAILLDLRGLNVIDPVDEFNLTVRVDAGVHGGELEVRLNEQGYTLLHQPRSLHLSTVGGWIATRATGLLSTKFGGIEEQIEAMDVVLPDGEFVCSKPVPRHGSGPRWLDLFLGSEGAFGVITGATIRVRSVPAEFRLRALGMPSYRDALDGIRKLLQRGIKPAVACLYDANESRFLHSILDTTGNHLLVVGFDGESEIVELEERLALEALFAAGGIDLGREPAWNWWDRRHAADWLIDGNEERGEIADIIDLSASWSVLPKLIADVSAVLEPLVDEVWYRSEHFYLSGAAVSFSFFVREATDERAMEMYRDAWTTAMRAALNAGGAIAHHHGIGQARKPWLREELGMGSRLIADIKRTIDPDDCLNPGRLLM
jgi:alkyldihydroxyacetonephosphate synthase